MKKKKVLFISSTGGHLNELLQLSPLFDKYDYHIITEKDKTNEYLKEKYKDRVNYLPYGTRSHIVKYIFIYFYLILKTIFLYFKIRPKVIVTTGTHTCRTNVLLRKNFWKQDNLYRNICEYKQKNGNRKINISNS